jgi:hypothetical protein
MRFSPKDPAEWEKIRSFLKQHYDYRLSVCPGCGRIAPPIGAEVEVLEETEDYNHKVMKRGVLLNRRRSLLQPLRRISYQISR